MMRPALAFLALMFFALPSQAQTQGAPRPAPPANAPQVQVQPQPRFWFTVTGAEGGYSVDMPGRPAERKLDVKAANGSIVTSYLQEVFLDQNATYFGMIWTKLSALPKDAVAAESLLMSARNNTAKALNGTLITTRPAKYQNLTGLEYVIEAGPNATRFRYRSFLVGNRMVQQAYSGTTGSENSADVRKFHDSLKLTP